MSTSVPLSDQFTSLISQFSSLSDSLITSLSTTSLSLSLQSSSSAPPELLLSQLADIDKQLSGVLQVAEVHQEKQNRIDGLVEDIKRRDREWRQDVKNMKESKDKLDRMLDILRNDTVKIRQASKANLDPDTILSYARLLAPFTSAPPRSTPAPLNLHSLPPNSLPPFPTEEVMRRGRLQFASTAEVDISGYGETKEMTGERPANQLANQNLAPTTQAQQEDPQTVLRKMQESKERQMRRTARQQEEEAADEFVFDLDLNPDLE